MVASRVKRTAPARRQPAADDPPIKISPKVIRKDKPDRGDVGKDFVGRKGVCGRGPSSAQKWLKDRRGLALSFDDMRHYQKIIKILGETDRIVKEIILPL